MHEPQTAVRGQPHAEIESLRRSIRLAERSSIDRAVPGAVVETRYYTAHEPSDVPISI